MSLIHPGQRNKTFIPQPFEIRRGSHGIDERVESGDALDPKNKADMLYSGDVMGEVRTPPYISNYNDGISHDSSSTMTVEGRASEHWTRTRQKLDFTVKDADKEPNLQVTVKRDFTGQGRLEIRNRGEFGGDGEINFPLGDLSQGHDQALSYEHQGADQVKFQKTLGMARVEVSNEDGTIVYVARDGMLFQEK